MSLKLRLSSWRIVQHGLKVKTTRHFPQAEAEKKTAKKSTKKGGAK